MGLPLWYPMRRGAAVGAVLVAGLLAVGQVEVPSSDDAGITAALDDEAGPDTSPLPSPDPVALTGTALPSPDGRGTRLLAPLGSSHPLAAGPVARRAPRAPPSA